MARALLPEGTFVMLEPYAGKLACTVLRGRGGGDTALLPGAYVPSYPDQLSQLTCVSATDSL
jgi:hypothetical protein